jgi:hypothetical protein
MHVLSLAAHAHRRNRIHIYWTRLDFNHACKAYGPVVNCSSLLHYAVSAAGASWCSGSMGDKRLRTISLQV